MPNRNVEVVLKASVGQFVSGMRQASAAVGDLDAKAKGAGNGTARSFDTLGSAAKGMGLATAAGIGYAVKSYANFDQAMSSVASTGLDAKSNMQALREAAMQAGADTAFSATEAANGMEAMMKAGMSAKDVYSGGLTAALNLAASGNLGVADSADLMATAMNNFGISGSQAASVADALAAGANKAQGDVSDMAAAFKYVSIPARDAGMSMEQTAGAVAQLASAGIVGEQAGTSLRSVLMSLTAPSKEAKRAMDGLGISLYDGNGKFKGYENAVQELHDKLGPLSDAQRDAALGTIFGNESISAARELMKGGTDASREWTSAVSEQGYASQLAGEKMNNLKGDWEQFTGSVETAAIKVGAASDGPLRKLVQGMTSLANSAGEHPKITQGILGVAGALTTLGVGAMAITKTVQGVREFQSAMQMIGIGSKGAGAAVDAVASSAGRLGGASRGAGLASRAIGGIGPAAVAAGVAIAGIGIARHFNSQNTAAIDATRVSVEQLVGAFQAANQGSREAASTQQVVNKAFEGTGVAFNDIRGGLIDVQTALNNPALDKFGTMAMDLVGMKSESQAVREAFGSLDQSLSSIDFASAAVGMQQVSRENAKIGLSTQELVNLFPAYAGKLREQASAMGVLNVSAQEMEQWMGGRLPASVRRAAEVAVAAGGPNAKLAADLLRSADAAEKLTAKVNSMPDTKTMNMIVKDAQAQTSVQGFVDKLKGLPPETVAKLRTIAETQGLDKAKAELAAIRDKRISLIINAASAQTTVAGFVAKLQGLPKETIARLKTIAETKGLDAAKKELAALKPKTVTATVKGDAKGAQQVNKAVAGVKGKNVTVGTKADLKGQKQTQAGVNSTKGKTVTVGTKADVKGQRSAQAAVNSTKGKTVTVGTKANTSGQRQAQSAVNSTQGKTVTVATRADTSGASAARAAIASVVGKTVNVVTNFIKRVTSADGNILDGQAVQMFANGGLSMREQHIAQIAPAGAWRVWAEEETGGEAYIPLAKAKRSRSLAILEQVASMFGKQVIPNAAGGVLTPDKNLSASWIVMQAVVSPLQGLATSMKEAAAATAAFTKAQKVAATPAAKAKAANTVYVKAVEAKSALNARQKREDLAYRQAILNAQKAGNKALAAGLQRGMKQNDITQAKAMAAATARVTAAQKKKTAADQAAAKVLEAARNATEKHKTAMQSLAEQQKAIADQANGASGAAQSQYRGGATLSEYMSQMRKGALDLAEVNDAVWRLRKAGLSKQVLDDLQSRSAAEAAPILKELVKGGSSAVAAANKASLMLDKYGDAVGWSLTTGTTLGRSVNTAETAKLRAAVLADTQARQQVSLSAETRRLAELLAQFSPINNYGANPDEIAARTVQYRNDQLTRAGI